MPENEKLNTTSVKYANVPEKFRRDVAEFLLLNKKSDKMDDLTPQRFLDYVLAWQGIWGYTEDIIQLMESLGWERPKPKVTIHKSRF